MTIQPRTLQGFRDFLPAAEIPRERLIETARRVYRSYGFRPIDTPALEYLEILKGKGGAETDRQIYHFRDHGGREVGLRFDLTVPLARFVAAHIGKLGTPFKRYHIGRVWRGERPQRGRYREFMQCDFDTIGTLSAAADIEMVLVVHDLMREIGVSNFSVHLNHRQVLNGVLDKLDLHDKATSILRTLDKLNKIGPDGVASELEEVAKTTAAQAKEIVALTEIVGDNDQILSQLEPVVSGSETGQMGLARLNEVIAGARAAGVPDACLQLDVAIARGLDYYTGTIIETVLNDVPSIGSVCSGGRYDNLTSAYTTHPLPGIGASLGLDRLLAALEELGLVDATQTTAPVFLPFFDRDRLPEYLSLAARIRAAGYGVEVYPEPKKTGPAA